jgi:hypothetical protein
MKDDVLDSPEHWMGNPSFPCMPSIEMIHGRGPCVLCCRRHGETMKASHFEYIHPPTSPTGCITTELSNKFAPVVPVPRTLHAMRAHHFSNSYHLTRVQGNYEGLDSMYLSTNRKLHESCGLADARDSLTIQGRSDMLYHVQSLGKRKKISSSLVKAKTSFARLDYPDIEDLKSKHCQGATKIDLQDAFELERLMKLDGGSTITVRDSTNNSFKSILFNGTWPKLLFWIHPVNKYGAEFSSLPGCQRTKDCDDARIVWFLLGMAITTPMIWRGIEDKVVNIHGWEGWLLTFATQYCFPHKRRIASQNCPFKAVSLQKLTEMILQASESDGVAFQRFRICQLFATYKTIKTFPDKFPIDFTGNQCDANMLYCYIEIGNRCHLALQVIRLSLERMAFRSSVLLDVRLVQSQHGMQKYSVDMVPVSIPFGGSLLGMPRKL